MAGVNEEIKHIVRISNQVNMAALNAMFIARKAGHAALGFGVVSADLRAFSRQLDAAMAGLSAHIFTLLRDVSCYARQWKTHRAHLGAACGCDNARRNLAPLLERQGAAMEQAWGAIQAREQELARGLGRARKLCGLGLAIARSGKIEAVHGAAMASELKLVSEAVERAIGEIFATLKALERRLAEQGGTA